MAADSRNIQVFVRCRPINDKERREQAQGAPILRFPVAPVEDQDPVPGVGRAIALPMGITTQAAMNTSRTYTFDRVFAPTVNQDTVFRSVMMPILDQVLAGFPCTVFAYGQTSSGKTHTMEGHLDLSADGQLSPHAGLIPRTLCRLFDTLEPSRGDQVSISCLEIYNEVLRDLLAADGAVGDLTLYEDKRTANVIVQGITEHLVSTPVDALTQLQRVSERRSIAATLMNQHSSRSHCVVTVTVRTAAADSNLMRVGKLHLVDLAGSESLGRTGTGAATQTREAGAINQSLLALGRVMTTLATKPGKHVPYRESKLTHLLKPALGGNSRTCMIATVSPARSNFEETQSTLEYAHRAKNIKNKPKVSTEHGVPRRGGSALSMVSFAGENDAAAYGVPAAPDAEQRALHEIIAQQRARIEQLQHDKAHLEAQLLQHQQMQLKVMESHRVALTAAHNHALEHKRAGARFRERVLEDERVLRVVSQRETKLRAVIGQLVESVEAFDRDMDEAWGAARRIAADARQVVEGTLDTDWTPSLAGLKADLTRLDEAHGAVGAALGDRLDALTGSLGQSIDRTHALFDDVALQLDGEFERLADHLGALLPDSSAAAVEQLAKLRENVAAALSGMADRASADLAATHAQSRTFLDSQAQEHDAFVDSIVFTLSSLHDHFARHAEHVRDLGTEIARFADTLRPQLTDVVTGLSNRHAVEQDAAARAGDELVREISGAVSTLLNRQLAAHDESVRAAAEDLTAAAVTAFDAWDARIAPVVQEMQSGIDDMVGRVASSSALDRLTERRDHVAAWSLTMVERISAGPPTSVESIVQMVDARLGPCDGALSRVDRLLAGHGSEMKTGNSGLQSVRGEFRRAMDELFVESTKRRVAAEEHSSVVNEAKIALRDMASAHQDAESAARSLSTRAPPEPLPIPDFPDLSRLSSLTVPSWEAVLATLPPLSSTTGLLTTTQPIDTNLPPIPSCILDPADIVPPPQDERADYAADNDLSEHEATPLPDPPGKFEFPYEVPEPEPAPPAPRKRKFGRDRSPSPAGSQSPARNVLATPKRQRMR
ncbi:hypothetical protein AMAG_07944 [Allomyces macrogynus ATCC 38327]|uniref:Kinesin motor domain-containing protein n=1 Tax=Allomyces macrogynus (strain ATCC 38327) TaxID=578462 RepID=A0A0L0SK05_ALLM3|nr:hypothetical protein AMAG_07944 [Allomyces macrogynus ATCC 38327]|eukprot:KNE62759.1 hypothetical protein AMAG_07944 [Allomyces macrogynus ATCC 38327]